MLCSVFGRQLVHAGRRWAGQRCARSYGKANTSSLVQPPHPLVCLLFPRLSAMLLVVRRRLSFFPIPTPFSPLMCYSLLANTPALVLLPPPILCLSNDLHFINLPLVMGVFARPLVLCATWPYMFPSTHLPSLSFVHILFVHMFFFSSIFVALCPIVYDFPQLSTIHVTTCFAPPFSVFFPPFTFCCFVSYCFILFCLVLLCSDCLL